MYIEHHLRAKAIARKCGVQWLESAEKHLDTASAFFKSARLIDITVSRMTDYLDHLYSLPSGRRDADGQMGTLGETTCRKYLNSLNNLYVGAIAEGVLKPGQNPVAYMTDKPSNLGFTRRPRWMEVFEAALFLEPARTYQPTRDDLAIPFAYELIATLLATGARLSEATGLYVEDVNLERKIVVIWDNAERTLKNRGSCRVVPLWPQLEGTPSAYLAGPNKPRGPLLFPVVGAKGEQRVSDIRKLLDTLAERIEWEREPIRSRLFRHTYCAARLQTLDAGRPVALYTVVQDMGHGSDKMVNLVYGHGLSAQSK